MLDLCKTMMAKLNERLTGRRKVKVKTDFQYGRTKIFFRNQAIVRLEGTCLFSLSLCMTLSLSLSPTHSMSTYHRNNDALEVAVVF